MRVTSSVSLYATASLLSLLLSQSVLAQDTWQPFKEKDERAAEALRQRARKAATDRRESPDTPAEADAPAAPAQLFLPPPKGTVERVELEPLQPTPGAPPPMPQSPGLVGIAPAGDVRPPEPPVGSATRSALGAPTAPSRSVALPTDLWRGVDMRQLELLIQPLDVPPRSEAMHGLWTRLFEAEVTPPAGGQGTAHYAALQNEVLYRSGLIGPLQARLEAAGHSKDPLQTAFRVRSRLAAADTDAACDGVKHLAARRGDLPKALQGEVHILSGYCAAVAGNAAAAGLAAELAREEAIEAPLALQALDAIAAPQSGPRPKFTMLKRLTVLDYRLLERVATLDPVQVLNSAEPALLYAMSQTAGAPPALAIAAAEAAGALNALSGDQLADVYARIDIPADSRDPLLRRAALVKQIAAERDGARKLALARQALDDARRAGLAPVLARALAVMLADVKPQPEHGAMAAVGAELALAAGDYARARSFAAAHPQAAVWAPLAELADPALSGVSPSALAVLDDAVQRNRFQPDAMHRLAVVLDALDTNVPIPLWEAASRMPQPTSGYLPETGTLPQLQEAVRKRELGRTALLVMRAVGPQGAAHTNLIALGDALRALRRAGLDADARRLAAEALVAGWPRG